MLKHWKISLRKNWISFLYFLSIKKTIWFLNRGEYLSDEWCRMQNINSQIVDTVYQDLQKRFPTEFKNLHIRQPELYWQWRLSTEAAIRLQLKKHLFPEDSVNA